MKWKAYFKSYQKIVESPNQWQIDESTFRVLHRLQWVVTEKIHGANFCFLTDGCEMKCAKRKTILADDEDFFHSQTVKSRFQKRLLTAFEKVQASYPDIRALLIYGELFGGYYPHPDVPADPLVQAIQTGVYYAPSIEFCAFDLAVVDEQKHRFLDYEKSMTIFEEVGLFYAVPLFVGEYSQAMAYPIPSQSTIALRLGFPPLFENNPAEGIVIKPMQTIYIQTNKGLSRPIIKKKIPLFSEKRFHQATKWRSDYASISILDQLEWEMLALVTENRLNNLLSKLGYRQKVSDELIIAAFCDEVWEQLSDEYPSQLEKVSQEEMSLLKTILTDEVIKLIEQDFNE